MMECEGLKLGSGLIRTGREWGKGQTVVASEQETMRFLQFAVESGIDYFDTAPAYGLSEQRLGVFLDGLDPQLRKKIRIGTKVGEYWDDDRKMPYVDHTFEAMRDGFERSLNILGQVDVLQLHKSTLNNLTAHDTLAMWGWARARGVGCIGVSVSNVDVGLAAVESAQYDLIQVPYNFGNRDFLGVITQAAQNGMKVLINRPFGMGNLVPEDNDEIAQFAVAVFRDIAQIPFSGYVLTGTASIEHLEQNIKAFAIGVHGRE